MGDVFIDASALAPKPENHDNYRKLLGAESDAELELIKKVYPRFMGAGWFEQAIANLNYQVKRTAELGVIKQVPDADLFVMP